MGGGDQLFGIGALLVLKTGLERIGRTLEHPRVGRESAGTSAACAVPNRGRFADHRKPPARERSPIGVARRALEAQYVMRLKLCDANATTGGGQQVYFFGWASAVCLARPSSKAFSRPATY